MIRAWLCSEPLPGPATLRLIRIVWGSAMLLTTLNLLGWNYLIAGSPEFFRLPLVPLLAHVAPSVHAAIVLLLVPASVCVLANFAARAASAVVALGTTYCVLFDYFAFHHGWVLLAQIAFLFVFVLDHKTKRAAICCLRALIVVVYLTAGLNKLNPSFLRGEVVRELIAQQWGGSALWDVLNAVPHGLQVIAIGAAILEIAVGVLLIPQRTRWLAYVVGAALHLGILTLTKAGLLLNVFMPASYLFFCWNEREPRRAVLPEGRLAAMLPKLDWNQHFRWVEAGDAAGSRLDLARDVVRSVPLLNPLFLVFGAMTLGLWAECLPNAIRGFVVWWRLGS